MNLQDMIAAINNRCDDVIPTNVAVDYLNSGQNILAIEVGAAFTQLSTANMTGTFDFDAKYHEIPVIYACMRFKEQDSVLTESNNYRGQFEQMKKWFIQNYQLPAYLRDDILSQQFVASAGQKAFVITKDTYDPQQGNLTIYKNGSRMVSWNKVVSTITDEIDIVTTSTTTNDPRGFIMTNACASGDKITALWEVHEDVVDPPMPWWAGQGW